MSLRTMLVFLPLTNLFLFPRILRLDLTPATPTVSGLQLAAGREVRLRAAMLLSLCHL